MPSSASRSETQGPLRSAIRPVSTSVPVTTIPALTGRSAHRQVGLSDSGKVLSRAVGRRFRTRLGSPMSGMSISLPSIRIATAPLPSATVKLPEWNGPYFGTLHGSTSPPTRAASPSTSSTQTQTSALVTRLSSTPRGWALPVWRAEAALPRPLLFVRAHAQKSERSSHPLPLPPFPVSSTDRDDGSDQNGADGAPSAPRGRERGEPAPPSRAARGFGSTPVAPLSPPGRRPGGAVPSHGGEALAVEPEKRRVGADEAAGVGVARQRFPFFVLDRPQVPGADLDRGLDLGKLNFAATSRLSQGDPRSAVHGIIVPLGFRRRGVGASRRRAPARRRRSRARGPPR